MQEAEAMTQETEARADVGASGHAALEPGVQAGPEFAREQVRSAGGKVQSENKSGNFPTVCRFQGESEDQELARAWEPGSTESREQRILSSKRPPLRIKDKERHASGGLGSKDKGFIKKGSVASLARAAGGKQGWQRVPVC